MPNFLKKWIESLSEERLWELKDWFNPALSRDIDTVRFIESRLADKSPSVFDPEDSQSIHDD